MKFAETFSSFLIYLFLFSLTPYGENYHRVQLKNFEGESRNCYRVGGKKIEKAKEKCQKGRT